MKKTIQLRKLLESPKILIAPGAYDCFSARLIQHMGFASLAVSGAGLSNSFLGLPDMGFLNLTDSVTMSRNIAASVDIPVTGDADTGYGNALSVYNTVRLFEQAGVAGINLEDQTFPKRCGHLKGKEIISAEEMVGKIRAAVEARKDPDFVITARTDAAILMGVDEAIARAKTYVEAGADMVFPDAITSLEDIRRFTAAVPAPVTINMGLAIRQRSTTPLVSFRTLEEIGVARVTFPRLTTAAAMVGMKNALNVALESYETGKIMERPDLVASFEELQAVNGNAHYEELDRKFLPEDMVRRKYKE
jgi:2-methylisocitrate lyase-like PEP mutase family enzyme